MSEETGTIERKLEYLRKLASIKGIYLSMLNWEALLPVTHMNIASNVTYRMLMDMYLNLNLGIDSSTFEWHPLDYRKMFTPEFPPHPNPANIGSMTPKDLENSLWAFRYFVSSPEGYFAKHMSLTLAEHIYWYGETLRKRGVDTTVIDIMVDLLAFLEGFCKVTTYVGLATVGVSEVMPSWIDIRNPYDWKSTMSIQVTAIYESIVGLARVGYCRVTAPYGAPYLSVTTDLTDHFTASVEDFRKRTGMVAGSPEKTLYQRIFMLQREQDYHQHGGEHQIKLQTIINTVKKVLDREGIMVQARMSYINFAQEIYYLKYEPHRLWKRYKIMLTEDEIIDKYKRGGLNEDILREIKGRVSP